jgi:DNA-binding FrmR family transcriptional regulator
MINSNQKHDSYGEGYAPPYDDLAPKERFAHNTYPHSYMAIPGTISFVRRMSHTIKNKQKLILRSKRIRGQFEALERVLDEGRDCSEALQIISAARGAVNSLMTELLEGHIRHHVLDPKRRPNSEQTLAADEVIDMAKTYLR